MSHLSPSFQPREPNDPDQSCFILVIEDDNYLRRLFSKTLGKLGYKVHAAGTLQLARSFLNTYTYDILLCDIKMDGGQFSTDLLREEVTTLDKKGTQIIMVSALTQYRSTCEDMGIEFFIEKPVALNPLITLVNRLIA